MLLNRQCWCINYYTWDNSRGNEIERRNFQSKQTNFCENRVTDIHIYFDNVFFHYIYELFSLCSVVECAMVISTSRVKWMLKIALHTPAPRNCIWFSISSKFQRYINLVVNGLFMVIRSIILTMPFLLQQSRNCNGFVGYFHWLCHYITAASIK